MMLAKTLRRLGACEESVEWAGRRRVSCVAWEVCGRGDWLIWLVTRVRAADDRTLRLIACDCAERALPLYESQRPGDDRPRRAIEMARAYAEGRATADGMRSAARAAYAVADAAAAAAAYAAYAVADADADAAAAAAARRAQADIVRRYVTWEQVAEAIEREARS